MNKNTQKDVKPVKKSSNNKATKKNVNKARSTKVTSENTNSTANNNRTTTVADKKAIEKPLKKTKSKETMVKTNKGQVLTNVPPPVKSSSTFFVNESEDVTDDAPPKFERSNSFSLSRGLSKVKNFFSGSKENLSKDPDTEMPFKFTRSRSLILMRRTNRRSVIEPQLEQLCEEAEKTGEKSPPVNKPEFQFKKTSVGSFGPPPTPQENFQRRRSSTFISSLKRTFTSTADKKEKLNPKWSASLQSLQAIDTMVKYDNMKFINYDQFNAYEKQLEMRLSQRNLEIVPPVDPPVVVRRRSKLENPNLLRLQSSCHYEDNLDKRRNLYRVSFDKQHLEKFNNICRDSFIWDKQLSDALNLEDGSTFKKGSSISLGRVHSVGKGDKARETNSVKLKSKSLTQLDGLEAGNTYTQETPLTKDPIVPSSEYFSVIFQSETGHEEDFIPVRKGVTLSEALQNFLAKRNLTFSQVVITDDNIISVQDGSVPHSSSTIDEHTDLDHLSGKVLRITEKDGSKKVLQKAASFGSRTRPPVLSSSASTEETTDVEPHKLTSKQKQRFSNFFGAKNSQQVEQVCALLNEYTRVGIPEKSSRDYFNNPEYKEAMQYLDSLEGSWKDFVNYEGMSNNEIKIQTAIWELVTTECDYIHILLTLTDLFLACLEALQDKQYLTDIDQNKLFSNIREICDANITFWVTYLYPMVANSQKTSFPMSIDYFHDGFLSFGTYFAPYKKYCAEQSTCQFYCKELTSSNQSFTAYLTWCEAHKTCNRLRLADILVRPMQRLTKYSLLLGAIRKNLFSVDEAENVDSMIHSVETFVCSVNTHLTTRQENERLKGVMARIEFYDVVETTNEHLDKLIKQYSKMFDLCAPMKGCPPNQGRNLFMEGDLKFKDSAGKVDVHCFILTDILLVCKTITKRGQGMLKVIRQPFLTDRLVVVITNNTTLNCVYLNEFDMAISAFILQCPEAKSWHDGLIRAKNAYNRIKQGYNSGDAISTGSGVGAPNTSNTSLRYLMQTSSSGGNADSLSVRKSPLNSSSRVSSSNNSHTGSVEWNDSRNVSVEFEKTNSISSDEGSSLVGHSHVHHHPVKPKSSPNKAITSNTLTVQPNYHLGQSLPNLNLHNPNSATLRRGFAFSSSIKNPPLLKTRNITSQNSISWHPVAGAGTATGAGAPSSPEPLVQQLTKPSNLSPSTSRQVSTETDV